MACNSLISYTPIEGTAVVSVLTYPVSGSVSIAGYTTPGWTTTTTVPAHSHWHENHPCEGGLVQTSVSVTSWLGNTYPKYGWSNCAYQGTTYTETWTHPRNVHKYSGVQLFPSTNFSASATITITFESGVAVSIPPPQGEPVVAVESAVFTISDFNISFDTININIPITESFTAQVNSAGVFDAQIGFPDAPYAVDQTIEIDGLGSTTYGFSLNPYLLLCATPVSPVSFVNLCMEVNFTISFNNPITNEPVSFTQGFSVLCPAPIDS